MHFLDGVDIGTTHILRAVSIEIVLGVPLLKEFIGQSVAPRTPRPAWGRTTRVKPIGRILLSIICTILGMDCVSSLLFYPTNANLHTREGVMSSDITKTPRLKVN